MGTPPSRYLSNDLATTVVAMLLLLVLVIFMVMLNVEQHDRPDVWSCS